MHALSDLRARADQRVRVDHRFFIDIRAYVDVRRRHHHHAFRDIRAPPNRRSAGHDAHAVVDTKAPRRHGVFVDECQRAGSGFGDHADAKRRQDSLLHPRLRVPHAIVVARRRADRAVLQLREKISNRFDDLLPIGSGADRGDAFLNRFGHYDNPHSFRIASSFFRFASVIGASGERTMSLSMMPRSLQAVLTGIGFDSMKLPRRSGRTR